MAGRERKRTDQPDLQPTRRQDEQQRTAEQARREQARREQVLVPKKGPVLKAVEDTVKAEAEVRKGESLARRIPPPPVVRERPEVVRLPIRPEVRAETTQPPQQALTQPEARNEPLEKPRPELAKPAVEAVKKEETVLKVSTEKSETSPGPVQEARPAEKPPAPKSRFRKAWDSFIGLFTRRTRAGRKEPPPSKGPAKAPERKATIPIVVSSGAGKALAAQPPPEEPGGYTILQGDAQIDLAAVQIAPVRQGVPLREQFPGLSQAQADQTQPVLDARRGTLSAFERRIRDFMGRNPEAFRPVRRMRMGADEIAICRPIHMGDDVHSRLDVVVPVFLISGGRTRLLLSYKSQSQGTWRRFAGCDDEHGHYYKGPHHGSENLQDLDWRIQKEIDLVAGRRGPADGPILMPATSLTYFSPLPADGDGATGLVVAMEDMVQASAMSGAPTLDLSVPENMPSRMLDYRLVGDDGDFYGRHACMILQSGNGRYLFGFALTDLGMFLQYVHDNTAGGTASGSPSRGVIVQDRDDWLLTPIIEYRSQTRPVMERRLSRVRERRSLVAGGFRSYLVGVHSSSGSPFFRLDNALSPLYPLLRAGGYDEAESLLGTVRRGERPLAVDERPAPLPADRVLAVSETRYRQLSGAFAAWSAHTESDEALMRRFSLTPRDLQVIARYGNFRRDFMPDDREFQRDVDARVRELLRVLRGLGGRQIDVGTEAGRDLVADRNLTAREIAVLNTLVGSPRRPADRVRMLRDVVEPEKIETMVDERLHWQATLWAQAELASGRIK